MIHKKFKFVMQDSFFLEDNKLFGSTTIRKWIDE